MKTKTLLFIAFCFTGILLQAQPQPEILYYKFDGSGTSVPNLASAPPAGTDTAVIMGGLTQGPTGQCGGALIGSGNASSTDYLNTGYAPNLTGSWTISMYTKDITPSSTLFYIFGDANSSSFRCFTNGVAGPDNWILRGPMTDVLVNGGATVAPHVTTFVYDAVAGDIYGYLDGVLVTTVAEAPFTVTGSGPFKVIGYGTNVGAPAGGKVDEFRMYDRSLSAAEVAELMNPATYNTISPAACNSYLSPAGHTYTASGVYTDTIPNSGGCDSIITINLTVNTPSASSFSATACDSYTAPSGAMFTSSGTYMDTIPNVAGCDSVMTINLAVLNATSSAINPAICNGDIYTAPSGAMYSAAGTYMDTIPNVAGCDSVITIALTVNTVNTNVTQAGNTLTATASGATYQWIDCSNNAPVTGATAQSFSPVNTGNYAVIITENNCSDTSNCIAVNGNGISENELAQTATVYPNPNEGHFNLDLGSSYNNVSIVITDVTGRVILAQNALHAQIIPLELDADSGIYTIRITTGNQTAVLRLVKE